mgnify:CR=1 FL=1
MAAVLKHFPGHGAVVADSHLQLPVDRRDYGAVLDDMQPYERLINNGLAAGVMLAHVVYREMDELPAGFSQTWIGRELRGRLGFGGAVFCDDLSMKATTAYGSMRRRARLSSALTATIGATGSAATTATRGGSMPWPITTSAAIRTWPRRPPGST